MALFGIFLVILQTQNVNKDKMRRFLIATALLLSYALVHADEVMTKGSDGTYIVNTTTLCTMKGYRATTPLNVYIRKGKVVKVEALPSRETPKYYKMVKDQMLPNFAGKKAKDLKKVDGVTGATLSSNAVRENVKVALAYYEKAI